MSALASTFKCHLQLASTLLTCFPVVLFKAFHLLTVKVGVAKHCLLKALTTSMPFNSRSKSAMSARKMRMDVAIAVAVKDSRLLTVAAEDPAARFASFEDAVDIELVSDNPLGLADKRVLWTL
eukprot:1844208-Pleurochrysis_carterae.AAC.1